MNSEENSGYWATDRVKGKLGVEAWKEESGPGMEAREIETISTWVQQLTVGSEAMAEQGLLGVD